MTTQTTAKKPRRFLALKIVLIVLGSLILLAAVALGIYFYSSTHYWQADYNNTVNAGFVEKDATLADGSVIHYAEGPDNGGKALLLIHGQTGTWESYTKVLPQLSKDWHIFAVDCYGHGGSTHEESKYYLDVNGDDLIWFVDNVIGGETVVSGHSSGGLLASYVAAYGGANVTGAVLEDPPVYSTQPDYFERSFAYADTYKVMHDYLQSDRSECWEAYYLRHCLWGQLFMADSMPSIADYARQYAIDNPGKPVEMFFMPASINQTFQFVQEYDFLFGEHFYDYTWHAGIDHDVLMSDISVPTVFIHAKDQYTPDGTILMAASSNEQARRAVEHIGEQCELVELVSDHLIHWSHPKEFIEAINRLK